MRRILILLFVISGLGCFEGAPTAPKEPEGFADGPGATARFSDPFGVAVDGAGNVYVADTGNQRIRRIDATGFVTTLAGTGDVGFTDGPGASALLNNPMGVAVDVAGNVYVADRYNHRIRRIDPAGNVTTFAGSGATGIGKGGFADGPGPSARFNDPIGVVVDAGGNVFVADAGNHRIRRIDPAGNVTTFAGTGVRGYVDGSGPTAQFNDPFGVMVDGVGDIYVADTGNHRIRRIDSTGNVTTLAGTGVSGFADGSGTAVRFNGPVGVAVDAGGNVFVTDAGNQRIRRIDSAGNVTTYAGTGKKGDRSEIFCEEPEVLHCAAGRTATRICEAAQWHPVQGAGLHLLR